MCRRYLDASQPGASLIAVVHSIQGWGYGRCMFVTLNAGATYVIQQEIVINYPVSIVGVPIRMPLVDGRNR